MLTVEPWPKASRMRHGGNVMLRGILRTPIVAG